LLLAPDHGVPGIAVKATVGLVENSPAPVTVYMHIIGPLGFTMNLPDVILAAGTGVVQT
jgi:hypothetical protein